MKARCPESAEISPAVLSGYKLVERTFADIEACPGECVNGALYEISDSDLANLDYYEGYPRAYDRKEVMATDSSGVFRKALVYMMTQEAALKRNGEKFSNTYRQICSDGANSWGIPDAFSGVTRRATLWDNGIPDIADGLNQISACLDSGLPLPRAKRLWNGARVVISLKPQRRESDGFYPEPFEVITPHGLELSWLFNDLRDIFTRAGLIDPCNKFEFYRELAENACHVIDNDPSLKAEKLCRRVVEKAKEIYQEMK